MPKYLIKASYTLQGVKGVASAGGTARREAVERAMQSVGGTLEAFYFAFGSPDVYAIAEMPDNETAVAVALAVTSGGGATAETVVLVTPEEVDAAAKRQVDFTPAGG